MTGKTSKKRHSFSQIILSLLVGIPTVLGIVGKIIAIFELETLIRLEARLMGRRIIGVLILSIISAFLLAIIWSCLLIMVFFSLTANAWTAQQALLIIILINVILFILMVLFISRFRKKLIFPETRQRLQHMRKSHEHHDSHF